MESVTFWACHGGAKGVIVVAFEWGFSLLTYTNTRLSLARILFE